MYSWMNFYIHIGHGTTTQIILSNPSFSPYTAESRPFPMDNHYSEF
jgi:hypothetical protein